MFEKIGLTPLDKEAIDTAIKINIQLKQHRKQIAIADLFIAASAVSNKIPIATLNRKHFERVVGLELVEIQ